MRLRNGSVRMSSNDDSNSGAGLGQFLVFIHSDVGHRNYEVLVIDPLKDFLLLWK